MWAGGGVGGGTVLYHNTQIRIGTNAFRTETALLFYICLTCYETLSSHVTMF